MKLIIVLAWWGVNLYITENSSTMNMPLTSQQFFESMQAYNLAVFPAQLIIGFLAIVAVAATLLKYKHSGNIVLPILIAMWLWMGVVYHWTFFSAINQAAYVFGALFVLQSILFFYWGYTRPLRFEWSNSIRRNTGMVFVAFALLVYPAIGYLVGHVYPSSPTFGLPCPTTIFTLGMLLMAKQRIPWYIFTIPIVWSIIGFTAALRFSVYEDVALLISAAVFCMLMFVPAGNSSPKSTPLLT